MMKKTLNEINEKFNQMLLNQVTQHRMEETDPNNSLLRDAKDESMLYLSSNWSAGGFSDKLKWNVTQNQTEITDKIESKHVQNEN